MPWWLRSNAGLVGVLVLIGAVYLIGATVSDRFLTLGNLLNVYEQTTDLALVSIGQTLTILSGGIDLSVGSLISLTSCLGSGLIVSFGLLHLAPAVTEFLALHPDVSVEMLVNDRVVDLLEGEFDVGVRIGRLRDSSLIADASRRSGLPSAPRQTTSPVMECRGLPMT
jgi:ABC-type glucose/galactose transport system permease subunit